MFRIWSVLNGGKSWLLPPDANTKSPHFNEIIRVNLFERMSDIICIGCFFEDVNLRDGYEKKNYYFALKRPSFQYNNNDGLNAVNLRIQYLCVHVILW